MCDYVKFETGQSLLPILKKVTCTEEISCVAKRACDQCSIFSKVQQFALTTGFYWSYTLLLKSPILVRSWCTVNQAIKSFTIKIPVANASASDRCAFTHEGICDVGESREH